MFNKRKEGSYATTETGTAAAVIAGVDIALLMNINR